MCIMTSIVCLDMQIMALDRKAMFMCAVVIETDTMASSTSLFEILSSKAVPAAHDGTTGHDTPGG